MLTLYSKVIEYGVNVQMSVFVFLVVILLLIKSFCCNWFLDLNRE